nr:Ig-like domain-containing protein [Streptomyces jeddahensis]
MQCDVRRRAEVWSCPLTGLVVESRVGGLAGCRPSWDSARWWSPWGWPLSLWHWSQRGPRPRRRPATRYGRGAVTSTVSWETVPSTRPANRVAGAQSTTTLTVDPQQPQTGAPVTFSATVTCTLGIPAGTVTFTDNGQEIGSAALEDGTATLVTGDLAEGEHTITANFASDLGCPASSSEPVTITVTAAPEPSPTPTTQPTSPSAPPEPATGAPTPQPTTSVVAPPLHGGLAHTGTSDYVPQMAAAAAGGLTLGSIAVLLRRRWLRHS